MSQAIDLYVVNDFFILYNFNKIIKKKVCSREWEEDNEGYLSHMEGFGSTLIICVYSMESVLRTFYILCERQNKSSEIFYKHRWCLLTEK